MKMDVYGYDDKGEKMVVSVYNKASFDATRPFLHRIYRFEIYGKQIPNYLYMFKNTAEFVLKTSHNFT